LAYIDSTLQANKQYEEQFNAMLLLRMEQKESARQQQELSREKEVRRLVQIRLLVISAGFAVIFILSVLLLYLYRKKRNAYLGLYRQIREQDRLADELEMMTKRYELLTQNLSPAVEKAFTEEVSTEISGDMQQYKLMLRLREYLLIDRNFTKADLERDEIVVALNTNKTYLYEAIRAVYNRTLQEHINLLRLEESRRMLEYDSHFTIEAIADACGFKSIRTFYRLFREHYHITPTDYRKMAKM
jgi:AraC-like DNA-binding protein